MSEVVIFMFHSSTHVFLGGGRGADFSLFEFWYLLWQSSVILYLGIIPDSCSSKRRHIFNQHHFPFVLWEADLFSFEVYSFEIIKWLAHFPRIPVAQREVLIRWSILWGIHFSLQKRKSLLKGTFTSWMLMSLFFKMFRPHFLTFSYS